MPVVLPPNAAMASIRHAIFYQWELTDTEYVWTRVLFMEGAFSLREAQNFLRNHKGLDRHGMQEPQSPAEYFSGPVICRLVTIGPGLTPPQLTKILAYANQQTRVAYMNAYQWAVQLHQCNFDFQEAFFHTYVLNLDWAHQQAVVIGSNATVPFYRFSPFGPNPDDGACGQ